MFRKVTGSTQSVCAVSPQQMLKKKKRISQQEINNNLYYLQQPVMFSPKPF